MNRFAHRHLRLRHRRTHRRCARSTSACPHESTVYFGDTARVPYGPKSPETVRRYSLEILDWLLRQGVKAVVVACNTSTAHALETLQAHSPVPVIGVIEPGAQAAAAASAAGSDRRHRHRRHYREQRLRPRHPARRRADARVEQKACPLFVPLVEEGWFEHPAAELIAREYLEPLRQARGGHAGARLHPLSAAEAAAAAGHGAGCPVDRQRRGDRGGGGAGPASRARWPRPPARPRRTGSP